MWQTIKREELYEEVWSTPLTQLCAKYGLSDNGLRKVCKRLNVPIPWRGYCDAARRDDGPCDMVTPWIGA